MPFLLEVNIYSMDEKQILENKYSAENSHFHLAIGVDRNNLGLNSLIASFNENLIINIHLFSVFHNTCRSGRSIWLHVSGYHSTRCDLQSV